MHQAFISQVPGATVDFRVNMVGSDAIQLLSSGGRLFSLCVKGGGGFTSQSGYKEYPPYPFIK